VSPPHAELIPRRFGIGAIRFGELALKSGITWLFSVDEGRRSTLAHGSLMRPSREFVRATRVA